MSIYNFFFYNTGAGIFLSNGQFDICHFDESDGNNDPVGNGGIGGKDKNDGTGINEGRDKNNETVTDGSNETGDITTNVITLGTTTATKAPGSNIKNSSTHSTTIVSTLSTTVKPPILSTPYEIGLSCDNANVSWLSVLYRVSVYLFWIFILADMFCIWLPMPIGLFEFIIGPSFSDLVAESQHTAELELLQLTGSSLNSPKNGSVFYKESK